MMIHGGNGGGREGFLGRSRRRIHLQSEAAECGLACIATVADHHGLETSLVELRQQFPMSLKGAKLSQLMQIAQRLGFQTRALRLELDALSKLRLPCILHWDMNHFVVLTRIGRRGATIFDPARGERRITLAEVSAHFTGVALEIVPSTLFRPQRVAPAVSARQLTGRISGLWPALVQLLLLSVALQLLVLLTPLLMQWVVDQVLVSADRSLLLVLALGFAFVVTMQVGIGQLRGWAVIYLSSRLNQQWTSNVFAHLLKLPLDFFQKRNLGDVTSRLSSVQAIQRTLTTSFVESIMDGLMALVTLSMMLFYSRALALVTLLAVALYLGLRSVAYRHLRDSTERQLMAAARQQTYLLESLRGMQSLKLGGGEPLRQSTYENLIVGTVNEDVRLARMSLGFTGASQLVFGLERIAVIAIGALLAMDNVFSVGMLIAYLAYKDQFATRMSALIDKWVEFRMLRLHGERLADIVLAEPEEIDASRLPPPQADLRIVVDNLSFRYAEGEPWVLRHCSFEIEPGASVAITGASGCGKTTLIKLMLGLLKATEGTISVGGQDIRQLGVGNYRAMIGAVMQDDQLFAGSIAENIAFFDQDVDQSRIETAARLAAVHDEIVATPMGYHSLIGDMGSSLSGGQKQRIILARALCREPKLLFLDEATSHLDMACERLVNDAVERLKLTKVIVAHRPETIASADMVLPMEEGRVTRVQPQRYHSPASGGRASEAPP